MPLKIYAVTGLSGSGKTTVADALVKHYQLQGKRCIKIAVDNYYRANPEPDTNFDDPAAVELELLAEHLAALKRNETIEVPIYSIPKENRLAETKTIDPSEDMIIIVEGIFALRPELCEMYDAKIYVNTPIDICLARRLIRDKDERDKPMEGNLHYYLNVMRPNLHFIKDTKKYADHLLPNSNPEDIEQLINKLDPQTQQSAEPTQLSAPRRGFFPSAEQSTGVPPSKAETTIVGKGRVPGFSNSEN
jgi:uridine kinase